MLTQAYSDGHMQMPSLESVATDPLILPLPTPLSPLSALDLDKFFPVCLAGDDALAKMKSSDSVYMLTKDSFETVNPVISSMDADGADSCQSYANEREDTPPVGLIRLSTINYGEGLEDWGLRQQSSHVTFVDAVMSPPTVTPNILGTGEQTVNQDVLTPPIFHRPTPFSVPDPNETRSSHPIGLDIGMGQEEPELDVNSGEATPPITEPTPMCTEDIPHKPPLVRLFPQISHPQEQGLMDTTSTFTSGPQMNFNNTETAPCKSKSCLKSRVVATPQKRDNLQEASQQSVTFRQLVKVNTAGEAELNSARLSTVGEPAELSAARLARTCRRKRRKQKWDQTHNRNQERKTLKLPPYTTTAKFFSRSLISQVSTTVTKRPVRATRESLRRARLSESKLKWTPWRPCNFPDPINKSRTPIGKGHSRSTNQVLFQALGSDP